MCERLHDIIKFAHSVSPPSIHCIFKNIKEKTQMCDITRHKLYYNSRTLNYDQISMVVKYIYFCHL